MGRRIKNQIAAAFYTPRKKRKPIDLRALFAEADRALRKIWEGK
jgi:hypothetical protein